MASVFLSYAREDRPFAEKLARLVEGAGHNVWWDRHIGSGREFAGEIETELAKADLVLVAWSKAAAKSPWVRDEAAIGRDRGRLLPVLVDGSEPPIGFRQLQALDLTGWSGRRNDRRSTSLLEAVESIAAGSVPGLPEPKRLSAWRKGSRPRLIAAALALLIVLSAGFYILNASRAEAEPASLAVLPFKNMSAGDPYFAEGVAEEIANELGREPQFKVAGRTSSALFKDAADLRDVGRRLHVAYVLEGSVRSAGNQVRVAVSLVNAKSGARIWSQDFRGSLDDIFAIQDSIGQQVAANVKRQLVATGTHQGLTTTGEVYALYVTARSLMHQREPSKIKSSIELLKRAVKLDPQYAPAWARLAVALELWERYGDGGSSTEAERIRYAERAVAIAPQLGDGHAALGLLLSDTENPSPTSIRRSREELEKAVSLNPGDAESWYWLHYLRLGQLNFEGALDALRRSARIDPFFVLNLYYPLLAWDMGYRDEALQFQKDRIANHPDPMVREMAQVTLAAFYYDASGAYAHAKKARAIALPDVRSIPEAVMGSTLLQLWLLDEAERFVPRPIVDLRRGKLTFVMRLRQAFPRAIDFWIFQDGEGHFLPKALVNRGGSGELVSLYDEAFQSPEDMASRLSNAGFVNLAPPVAISLQKAGRTKDGARILLLGENMCRKGMAAARSPRDFRVKCSRLWSVLGRKDLAVRTLETAVSEGWRPAEADYPTVTDEPAYAVLRDEPRMKRINAILAADLARERRELLAAGL